MILVVFAVVLATTMFASLMGIEHVFARQWAGLVTAGFLPLNVLLLVSNLDAVLRWWEDQIMRPFLEEEVLLAVTNFANGEQPFKSKVLWQEP